MIPQMFTLHSIFQDVFNDILYFSVAQKFVDFVVFTRLRNLGKYIDLRNREIWKYMKIWKTMDKRMGINVLGTVQNVF